jgi:RNA polymerase sigma-70 factor (ECF subfamily)
MTMKNDEIIFSVKQCLNGRTEAFAHIIRQFQEKIHRLCLHYLGTAQDAEDAAAEVFVKAYKALNTFNPQYKFSTWIFKIAVNHSLQILRRQKLEKDYLVSEFSDESRLAETNSPDHVFFKDAQKESLDKAIKTLPVNYRTALLLKYGEGFSYKQIGDIMEIPVNTVGSLVLRGKKELRERIKFKEGIK